jgi:hypothetical protein
LPWLLIQNLLYLIFGNLSWAVSAHSLALGNFIGVAYPIGIQWAIKRGIVYAWVGISMI